MPYKAQLATQPVLLSINETNEKLPHAYVSADRYNVGTQQPCELAEEEEETKKSVLHGLCRIQSSSCRDAATMTETAG